MTRKQKRQAVDAAGRAGLAARGLLYAAVGVLALQVAVGRRDGEEADGRGALAEAAERPLGRVLLLVLAVGFAGYAAWHAVASVRGTGKDTTWARRAACAGRGLLYAALAALAVSFAFGGNGGGGGSDDLTARLTRAPAGRLLLGAVGLALLVVAALNGRRALSRGFARSLGRRRMSRATGRLVRGLAIVGLAGRMLAFGLVGVFVVRAAWTADPREPTGLDAALHQLAGRGPGAALVAAVAAGMLAFGAYCLLQVRYREVVEGEPTGD